MNTYLYFIKAEGVNIYKIGYSANPKKRLKQLQTGNWHNLRIVGLFQFSSRKDAARYEALLHQQLNKFRMSGEWYKLTPKHYKNIINIL